MTDRLSGHRVLVVGGGSGIGRAAALGYLAEGAEVTVLERSEAACRALERDGASRRLSVVAGDGTAYADLEHAVRVAAGDDDRLDHLTCCVGAFDHYARIEDLDPGALEAAASESWRFNVLSVLLAARAAATRLRRARGSITLTLSESAFHAVGGGVLYGSAKWAVRGAVAHLAAALAPDVRVNAVAPGGTSGTTFAGLTSLGTADRTVDGSPGRNQRIAAGTLLRLTPTPESHVGAYVYLADPAASGVVTGQVINTDGGRAAG